MTTPTANRRSDHPDAPRVDLLSPAQRAEAILVAHQRRDISGCICGWSELGKSHPGHQVAMLREAALQTPTLSPDLAAIQTRLEAATDGPWIAVTDTGRKDGVALVGAEADRGTGRAVAVLAGTNGRRHADAEFIAHARQDVPALLAALARVRDLTDPTRNPWYVGRDQILAALDGPAMAVPEPDVLRNVYDAYRAVRDAPYQPAPSTSADDQ